MAGINAGPSQGFWGRIGANLPGALNMAGSMMPGPFGQTSKIAGSLMRKPKETNPDVQGRQTTMQNGPNGMPPTGPSPFTNGVNRGGNTPPPFQQGGIVRMPNISFGLPGGVMGPGGIPRNGNTGITGGMGGMFPGGMRIQPQPAPDMPQLGGGSGLWNIYSNLSNETGVPNRQLFY